MYTILAISLVTLTSVVYVMKRLCTRSTSTELKKVLLKRHIVYFVFFILFLFHTNLHLLDKQIREYLSMKSYYLIATITNSVGICLAALRFFEPYVFQRFLRDFRKLFCCSIVGKKQKFYKESLDSFLKSAMNLEYVYLILLGINRSFDRHQEDNDRSFVFQNYQIANNRDWNVTDSKFASRLGSENMSGATSAANSRHGSMSNDLIQFEQGRQTGPQFNEKVALQDSSYDSSRNVSTDNQYLGLGSGFRNSNLSNKPV